MGKRELVLTGLEEFWPSDEKSALFLGPWCFAFNKKYYFWEQDKFNLAPSPWPNKNDIYDSSRYIDNLYDRLLPDIANLLNQWYGTDFSDKFWKISTVTWFIEWLNIFYERYRRLENITKLNEKFIVKLFYTEKNNYLREYDPLRLCNRHDYNLFLFSLILNESEFINIEKQLFEYKYNYNDVKIEENKSLLNEIKDKITNYLSWTINSDINYSRVYGLSRSEKIKLNIYRKRQRKPKSINYIQEYDIYPTCNSHNDDELFDLWIKFCNEYKDSKFIAENKFEVLIQKIIYKNLPLDVIKCISSIRGFGNIKYWIGADLYNQDSAFKIARLVERGGKYISVQHGGGYGQWLSFPQGKIEYETADSFISWGWSHRHIYDSTIIPLPSVLLSNIRKNNQKTSNIILLNNISPAYSYRFQSVQQPEDMLNHIKGTGNFIRTLNDQIKKELNIKLYVHDFGLSERKHFEKFANKSSFIDNSQHKKDNLWSAKLMVIDHLGTGILESLSINTPTIAFWDPEHFAVMDIVKEDFLLLEKCGIYHRTPESAAEFINDNYEDIPNWWNSKKVQESKNYFVNKYALNSKNYLSDWKKFIKELP